MVQEHFARTHHYDFRLERDGVFKSWVLRKSVTNSPGVRLLAIQVEDHDLKFGDFEGRIPRGEYGAGKISIWDSAYVYESDVVFHRSGTRLRKDGTLGKQQESIGCRLRTTRRNATDDIQSPGTKDLLPALWRGESLRLLASRRL